MKGFTLIEVLVAIGIFLTITGVGLFMTMETFRGTIYRSEVATIVSLLERARSRAMNNINQSKWGVCYIAPNYVIFKGAGCTSSAVVDSVKANPVVVTASGFTATYPLVVFTQLSGTTTAIAPIVVKQDGRISTTTINNEGTIIW